MMKETPDEDFWARLIGWLEEKPSLLFIFGFFSVGGVCLLSQILVRFSKQSNISLNKYYKRRRSEKQKQMETMLRSKEHWETCEQETE